MNDINWEMAREHYEMGVLPVRQIAVLVGVSHVGIMKRARKENWARRSTAQIQALADAKVLEAEAAAIGNGEVLPEVTKGMLPTQISRARRRRRELIEATAESQAKVRIGHRRDIAMLRDIVASCTERLAARSQNIITNQDLTPLQRAKYANAIVRDDIEDVEKLSRALDRVIALERQAYGIPDVDPKAPPGGGAESVTTVVLFPNGGPGQCTTIISPQANTPLLSQESGDDSYDDTAGVHPE